MINNNEAKSFLGVGWKFPIQVDKTTGRIKTSSYEEDIKEAIKIIIMTRKGERVMKPEFGCNLQNYVFDILNNTTLNSMKRDILEALILWEPRIIEPEVNINFDNKEKNKVNIEISYKVRSTNNQFNLVYPYYINEGILD